MPYLQVDLDAMKDWPIVAKGCEVSVEAVYRGFLDLWNSCWRQKSGYVGLLQLEAFFGMPGRGERLVAVLVAFGFLEKRDLGWWVCGSEKYLRVTEARAAGGKKASANLKRGKSPGSSRKPAGKQPESVPGSGPALTPITEHQSPSNKETTLSAEPTAPGPEERVFQHWKTAMGKGGKTAFDAKRRRAVRARLADGYGPDDLCRAVDGCAKTPHNMGQNDRGERYDDLELICRDAAHVDRFIRNASDPPLAAATKGRASFRDTHWDEAPETEGPEILEAI